MFLLVSDLVFGVGRCYIRLGILGHVLLENPSFSASLIRARASGRDRAARLAREAQSRTAALYSERGGELLSYAVSVARDEELARDALQEVFMRYFVALCEGEDIRAPRAWIYRVLHNYLMDRMKDPHGRGYSPFRFLSEPELAKSLDLGDQLLAALLFLFHPALALSRSLPFKDHSAGSARF